MTDITRRDFLKIAFGTVSAAVLAGPLAAVWPDDASNRPVADPWLVDLDDGYLIDRSWTGDDWPTLRDFSDYDALSIEEKVEFLLEYTGQDEASLFEWHLLSKPRGGWHARALARIEEAIGEALDANVDADRLSFHELLYYGPYAVGGYLLDHLPADEQKRLGLRLVEGEYPGSDFVGVRVYGEVAPLNEALARQGINVLVRDVDALSGAITP